MVANQRNSIYLSSDSSDEVVRGEVRRGSAPTLTETTDKGYLNNTNPAFSSRPNNR